jgi:hypothetical protein
MESQCNFQNPQFFISAVAQSFVCFSKDERTQRFLATVQGGMKNDKVVQLLKLLLCRGSAPRTSKHTCDNICAAEYPSIITALTLFLMGSKEPCCFRVPSTSIAFSVSIPITLAKSLITSLGTVPAISCISAGVIGVGGSVDEESRDAD